ncbi:hypothetical protein B0T17DRAFT_484483 [Bombardia bombarda]|uniref:F-box domain-containing protein n=1 Tax=Bombardia bombarda TaxID=252184 RepID=A0AA39XMW3_9PEZI|nr:hypothetical protein B0T17DRAFT_484483 [Bombardia bombarda]
MDPLPTLDSLPNELLLSIVSLLPTSQLLTLLGVNRHFYSVTIRIFYSRLMKASSTPDHRVVLECYTPSEKLTTPYLYNNYLSTDTLDLDDFAADDEQDGLPKPTLGQLKGLYAHFKPVEIEGIIRPRLPRRGVPAHELPTDEPSADVYLDKNESFAQLCTVANIVKPSRTGDRFLSHANMSKGVVRVWRDWLAVQAGDRPPTPPSTRLGLGKGRRSDRTKDTILWADAAQNMGLRFCVVKNEMGDDMPRQPVLVSNDEDLPVCYRLMLVELSIRVTELLLTMEKSEAQEVANSGNALMIATI